MFVEVWFLEYLELLQAGVIYMVELLSLLVISGTLWVVSGDTSDTLSQVRVYMDDWTGHQCTRD